MYVDRQEDQVLSSLVKDHSLGPTHRCRHLLSKMCSPTILGHIGRRCRHRNRHLVFLPLRIVLSPLLRMVVRLQRDLLRLEHDDELVRASLFFFPSPPLFSPFFTSYSKGGVEKEREREREKKKEGKETRQKIKC